MQQINIKDSNKNTFREGRGDGQLSSLGLLFYRMKLWLKSPRPYLMISGLLLFLLFWYLTTEVLKLPRFEKLPGPSVVAEQWFSRDPGYGISIYTPEYYSHIWRSILRVLQAFGLATILGVPLGLFMGWKKTFKDYTFPIPRWKIRATTTLNKYFLLSTRQKTNSLFLSAIKTTKFSRLIWMSIQILLTAIIIIFISS